MTSEPEKPTDLSTDELLDRLEHRADELRDTEPLVFEALCRLGTADRIAVAAVAYLAVLDAIEAAGPKVNPDLAVHALGTHLAQLRREILTPDEEPDDEVTPDGQ